MLVLVSYQPFSYKKKTCDQSKGELIIFALCNLMKSLESVASSEYNHSIFINKLINKHSRLVQAKGDFEGSYVLKRKEEGQI